MTSITNKGHRAPNPSLQGRVQTELPLDHLIVVHQINQFGDSTIPPAIIIDHILLRALGRPGLLNAVSIRVDEDHVV